MLAVNEPLAARDPAQADPDRLATTACQQLHHQQKAERASRPQKAIALLRKSRRRRTAALGGLELSVPGKRAGLPSVLAQLTDPRQRHSRRHQPLMIVRVCAVLAGAGLFVANAAWAANADATTVADLGAGAVVLCESTDPPPVAAPGRRALVTLGRRVWIRPVFEPEKQRQP